MIKKASKTHKQSLKKIFLKKALFKKARPASKKALLEKVDLNNLKFLKIFKAKIQKKLTLDYPNLRYLKVFLLKKQKSKGKKNK